MIVGFGAFGDIIYSFVVTVSYNVVSIETFFIFSVFSSTELPAVSCFSAEFRSNIVLGLLSYESWCFGGSSIFAYFTCVLINLVVVRCCLHYYVVTFLFVA